MKQMYVMTVACLMTWAEDAVESHPILSAAVSAVVIWAVFL